MIKSILENAINSLEARKSAEVEAKKREVIQTQVTPYNVEIDKALQNALVELTQKANAQIVAIQEKLQKDKEELAVMSVNKKKANEETVVATETSAICLKFDKEINKLKKQLEEIGE